MEGIVAEDSRRYQRHAQPIWSQEPGHRAPLSETSQNSNSTVGEPRARAHAPPERGGIALPGPGSKSDLSVLLNQTEAAQRGVPNPSQPSPFHQGGIAAARPSLPSLKTVLGDTLTSPPKTPSPTGVLSRPSPPQSSLEFASTEAFSNKKQRTESFDFYTRPYGPEVASSTPSESTYTHHSNRHDHGFNAFDARSERNEDYRKSLPPLPTPGSATSRTSMQSFPSLQHANPSEMRSSVEESGVHRRTPDGVQAAVAESVSSSYPFGEQRQGYSVRDFRERAAGERPALQYAITADFDAHSPQSRGREPPGFRPSSEAWSSYPGSMNEGGPHAPSIEQSNRSPSQPREGYSSFPYAANASPVFMPSQFGTPPGKLRKRSNLPKHSTEIMKRWFEQNIANPYPSEEQKALFSQATGISMTQVSNWFINHRRRCPELQGKRGKDRVFYPNDGSGKGEE